MPDRGEPALQLPCLQVAWARYEGELLRFLHHRVGNPVEAEDLLHDLFLRAWRRGRAFCEVGQPRAWLFEAARNLVVDHARRQHGEVPLPEGLAAEEPECLAVDALAVCLPRVLTELSEVDREALTLCDLGGMSQLRFAELKGLSLAGAKSRVQRARARLRARMLSVCQVRFDESGRVCCFVPRPGLDTSEGEDGALARPVIGPLSPEHGAKGRE